MFDEEIGLSADAAARSTAQVEQYRPVLINESLEAVPAILVEDGVGALHAIAISRTLLGWAETPLRVAIDTVTTS